MIYLASKSPRRKQLMELMGLEFKVMPSDADESCGEGKAPKETVEFLSRIKAESLVLKVNDDDIIIGSDTVVSLGNEILGKPKDENDAIRMLKLLSGKTHSVFTGVTIIRKGVVKTFSQKTDVTFFELDSNEIKSYVETKEPMDKAGAYGIQEKGSLFVKEIHGDFWNVVGLPIASLKKELQEM